MTSDMLSQEEIDALLRGGISDNSIIEEKEHLNATEADALGEIGNISMGTAATTLSTLLGQKVNITTPKVALTSMEELASLYPLPFVAVDVKYKLGLIGANLLILNINDVKIISDLMMGGDGTNTERELSEMDLSAISEAMNQMVGSSCTSLSEMFSGKIDIDPPRAFKIDFLKDDIGLKLFHSNEAVVKISFKMIVGNLIDSEIMQLIPITFAKKMVSQLLGNHEDKIDEVYDFEEEINTFELDKEEPSSNEKAEEIAISYDEAKLKQLDNKKSRPQPVNVRKVEFQSFDNDENSNYNESIEIVREIPIEITVELGRTFRKISEILEYGPGTIVELDKLVGEPLNILANGKFIAKGEVVVIDDSFGIRITDIINPNKRINKKA